MTLRIDFSDIQVCMLTYNEGKLLEYTLPSMKTLFSSFAIIDQSSTDNTIEIVKDVLGDAAAVAVEHKDYIMQIGFSGARNRVSGMCTRPWVFHVDADELVFDNSGEMAAISEHADASAKFLSVRRRNLVAPPGNALPASSDELSRLSVHSDETHVRLYRNEVGFRWHSFIHEELWHDGRRVPHATPDCSLVLDHLSQFKGFDTAVRKEAYYAWMLLRGARFPADDERALSEYCQHVLSERRQYFTEQAVKFEDAPVDK